MTVKQFGAIGDNNESQNFTDTVNGFQRFTSVSEVHAQYLDYDPITAPEGRAFELMQEDDTLDWVSIQSAVDSAMKEGFRLLVPAGVYVVRRPIWIGYGEQSEERTYDGAELVAVGYPNNHIETAGFDMEGECHHTRREGDGSNLAATIKLVTSNNALAFTNRFTLRLPDTESLSGTDTFAIQQFWGAKETTTTVAVDRTCEQICEIVEALSDIGDENIVPVDGTGGNVLTSKRLLAIQLVRDVESETKSFHGEFQIPSESYSNHTTDHWDEGISSRYVRCLADCGILTFRGSAQLSHRVANLNLIGIQTGAGPKSVRCRSDWTLSGRRARPQAPPGASTLTRPSGRPSRFRRARGLGFRV